MKYFKISLALLILLLFIYATNRNTNSVRVTAAETIQPAFSITNKISRKLITFLNPAKKNQNEIQKLQAKIKILEARLVQLEELSRENERLRKLLDFQKKTEYKAVPAQVIGRDPSNWTSIVYIDKGAEAGVAPNMRITTDAGLVGKVIEAGNSISKVMLINDPDSRAACLIQRTREEGLLCGTLSHRCRMIYISTDADVKIGDVVVTSDAGGDSASGILIGHIVDLFEDKGGLYLSAIVKPASDLQKLEEVLCIE